MHYKCIPKATFSVFCAAAAENGILQRPFCFLYSVQHSAVQLSFQNDGDSWGFILHNAELFIKEAKTTPAFPNKSRNYVTSQSQSNDIFENHECHRWFFPVVFFLTLLILTNVYINNNTSKNPIKKSSYSLYINFSWQVFVSSAL